MQAVAVGKFTRLQAETLMMATSRAGVALELYDSCSSFRSQLAFDSDVPACMIATLESLGPMATLIRDRAGWFGLPVMALVARPDDATFQRAYADGADDALPIRDGAGLQRRLLNLKGHDSTVRSTASRGLALVASRDRGQRRYLGRVLRQAGFEVSFAAEAEELRRAAERGPQPSLVVASSTFEPAGGEAAVHAVRVATRNPLLPGLVLDAPQCGGQDGATAHPLGDVKSEVLFFAEEALRAPQGDQRSSKRLHFAAMCAFRSAGSMMASYGMTHNISREGVFVRTLDPPRPGTEIWLELRTFDDVAVHLRGTVKWRRCAGDPCGPGLLGFGAHISAEHSPLFDVAYYERGYDNLLRSRECDFS